MKYLLTLFLIFVTTNLFAYGGNIDINVISDSGKTLPAYFNDSKNNSYRYFLEAQKGEAYVIQVTNNFSRRVGLVIAIDGRNIISGKKSWLKNNEKMYILNPGETAEYNGWRTSLDTINRFYFTKAKNSYAGAFDDNSSLGLIAVAVYPERMVMEQHISAPSAMKTMARMDYLSTGTGFGKEELSPSRKIHFESEPIALEKTLFKYEWRETLCKKGIITCSKEKDRLWNEGFVQPPPARY